MLIVESRTLTTSEIAAKVGVNYVTARAYLEALERDVSSHVQVLERGSATTGSKNLQKRKPSGIL
jgi:response regulator of citrate/malate metabolism